MLTGDDKKFILEFIQVYRSLPALWDQKNKDYCNRTKKNEQYEELLTKYKEKYPDADRKILVKKINSLRTNFRKELKRIKNSQTSGAGADEVVEPTLWYFDEMIFLTDLEEPSESLSSMCEVVEEEGNQETPISPKISETKPQPLKRVRVDDRKRLLKIARRRLEKPDDEYEKIISAWAVELKKMEPQQQLFAKRAINEILFEGQMGTLTRDSVQINIPSRLSTPYGVQARSPIDFNNSASTCHANFQPDYYSRPTSNDI